QGARAKQGEARDRLVAGELDVPGRAVFVREAGEELGEQSRQAPTRPDVLDRRTEPKPGGIEQIERDAGGEAAGVEDGETREVSLVRGHLTEDDVARRRRDERQRGGEAAAAGIAENDAAGQARAVARDPDVALGQAP